MKIFAKHIVRSMLENRLITLLVVLSLTVTSGNIYLNMAVKDQLLHQYKALLQGTYRNFSYYISRSNPDSEAGRYFDPGELNLGETPLADILPFNRSSGVVKRPGKTTPVHLYGMDLKLLLERRLVVLEEGGTEGLQGTGKQIIISRHTAQNLGIRLNDVLAVSARNGEERMEVAGIASDAGLFRNESGKVMIFGNFDYIGSLNGMGGRAAGLYVEPRSSLTADVFEQQFTLHNPGFRVLALHDEAAIRSELQTTNQLLLIVLSAVLVMVFYLNGSNYRIILAKRLPVLAAMRSAGATRLSMSLLLFAESLTYGLAGGVSGVLLGIGLQRPVVSALGSGGQGGTPLAAAPPYWGYAAAAVLLTAVFQAAVSAFGIAAASRRSIRESLAETPAVKAKVRPLHSIAGLLLLVSAAVMHLANTRYSLILSLLTLLLLFTGTVLLIPFLTLWLGRLLHLASGRRQGPAIKLAIHNVSGGRTTRSSITLITITLSVMLTVSLTTLSINRVFEQAGQSFGGDLQLTGISEPAGAYSGLDRIEGVQSHTPVYYKFDRYTVNGEPLSLGLFGLDGEQVGIRDESGKLGRLSAGEGLIDRYYGLRHGLDIGDELVISRSGMQDMHIRIAGYVDAGAFSSQRNVLAVSQAEYLGKVSTVPSVITVEAEGDVTRVKEDLIAAMAGTGVSVQTVDEILEVNRKEVDSLLSLITLILGLAAGIAVIGVMVNQFLGFLSRRKEYAVLYSIGLSRAGLNTLILAETAAAFLTGCLLAGMLGILLSISLEDILNGIGQYVEIGIDPASSLALLAAMFLLLMLASLVTLIRLPKLDMVREIKYE